MQHTADARKHRLQDFWNMFCEITLQRTDKAEGLKKFLIYNMVDSKQLTNSMRSELFFKKTKSHGICEEIRRYFWNHKVHCRVCNVPPH
jgi:hypothetical protein